MSSFKDKFDQRKSTSNVCIGLDPDISKMPAKYNSAEMIFDFNKVIIDATAAYTAAYKPNSAFYEQYGLVGLEALKKTIDYIPDDIPVILDAKRGDIGNTARAYAKAAFDYFQADAITVAPYMGEDSIVPFLEYEDKYSFILGLTSNKSAQDFEKPDLYLKVSSKVNALNEQYGNCGLVAGATQASELKPLRDLSDQMIFLVPGIGAQGGDLAQALGNIKGSSNNFLINSSRGIIYASSGDDFAEKAGSAAQELQQAIAELL